jgi:hypothetical protein
MALNLAKSGVKMPKETHPKSIVRLHFPFYDMKDTPHPEGDKLKPEGTRGRWWNETLRGIGAIGGNFGVVRCGAFYGPGTWDWEVMPRLVIGHVYKYLNEEMKFLHK